MIYMNSARSVNWDAFAYLEQVISGTNKNLAIIIGTVE